MVKKKPKISVIGLGFVGLSIALTNAKKGFFSAFDPKLHIIPSCKGGFIWLSSLVWGFF